MVALVLCAGARGTTTIQTTSAAPIATTTTRTTATTTTVFGAPALPMPEPDAPRTIGARGVESRPVPGDVRRKSVSGGVAE